MGMRTIGFASPSPVSNHSWELRVPSGASRPRNSQPATRNRKSPADARFPQHQLQRAVLGHRRPQRLVAAVVLEVMLDVGEVAVLLARRTADLGVYFDVADLDVLLAGDGLEDESALHALHRLGAELLAD